MLHYLRANIEPFILRIDEEYIEFFLLFLKNLNFLYDKNDNDFSIGSFESKKYLFASKQKKVIIKFL